MHVGFETGLSFVISTALTAGDNATSLRILTQLTCTLTSFSQKKYKIKYYKSSKEENKVYGKVNQTKLQYNQQSQETDQGSRSLIN